MSNMEFWRENLYNTTTMIRASTGTGTFANLFDRSRSLGYSTVGHSTNTATQISIVFAGPTVVGGGLILNHNLKDFIVFINSTTAASITYTGNSMSSTYVNFGSLTVNTFDLQLSAPQTADTEMRIGELVVSELLLSFTVNPPHTGYKPEIERAKVIHKMPDGGVTMFQIKNKFRAKVKLEFAPSAMYSSLKTLYEAADPMWFIQDPTSSGNWDAVAHEVLWTNDFNFTWQDNSKSQGYGGEIELMETPSA